MTNEEDQRARREHLSADSNRLLDAIDKLHDLEKAKRSAVISTPPFHAITEEVRDRSREVFRIASRELDQADDIETAAETLDDISDVHRDPPTDRTA